MSLSPSGAGDTAVPQGLTLLRARGACHGRGDHDDRWWSLDETWVHRADDDIMVLCSQCPVKAACLDYALENEETNGEAGVWGGTTPYQRQQLKRDRSRVYCPGCGSDAVVPAARGEVCLSCGVSWTV